ncbi:uncharacterized protein LOC110897990 isoform X2 [Helianthus annuus]|uniref:uncharacterized protein LOC110897990 isoform X2 n=1 Tax=Helianthus annuus TaxID=4232 RepID=UPI000B90A016|nr:uncharacterized protein LOC110897990 isoform X2 [Helianthus annuus]
MSVGDMSASNDLQEALKPFHQRASEAEERLAKLEAALATKTDTGSNESSNKVAELQKLLEDAESKRLAEREKALKDLQRVSEENAKLHYRITHLVRALEKSQ